MMAKNAESGTRAAYEKPTLVRVQLDVKASTLGVNCWNSTYTDMQTGDGCQLSPTPTCSQF